MITEETTDYFSSLPAMLRRFDSVKASKRFRGATAEELADWQAEGRHALAGLIGLDRLMCPQDGGQISRTDGSSCEEIRRETLPDKMTRAEYTFRVDECTQMPMYILRPPGKAKGIYLALAGHQGGGRESVAGVRNRAEICEKIEFFNYDYGYKLAKKGYITVCPDPRGFGKRREAAAKNNGADDILSCSCRNISNMAIPLGLSVAGLCAYDHIRLIDHLFGSGIVEKEGCGILGVIGFSGGGMQALYLSALDTRISHTIISGYMYGFRDSLLLMNNNCSCNYVPGLWEQFDMGDIACMIAPRPLVIQSCEADHLNGPRGMDNVYEQMDIIRKAYRLAGAEENLIHDVRPGGHRFHDEVLNI